MANYSDIVIICNPFSSGPAETRARRLAERLEKRGVTAQVRTTEYAGHAEIVAEGICQSSSRPLIISASGDGGFNEVINGIMRAKAQDPACQAVCCILPAGNANDHRRSVRKHPLVWAITRTQPEPMDLLELEVNNGDQRLLRYAHSYIGLGITSHAAAQLNQETLGPLKEILLVARVIFAFHPVAVIHEDGKTKSYDSLVFLNIHHMAKVLRTGSRADINNGSFRVASVPHRSQFWLVRFLLNLSLFVFGLAHLPQQDSYQFSVPHSELIHLDGEVLELPAGAQVTVRLKPAALQAIR